MTDDDARYFRNRAAAERAAAAESPNQSARAVHRNLAALYDEKIRNESMKLQIPAG